MLYVCEYCQEVIRPEEVNEEISLINSEPLTAENQEDIMKRVDTSPYYRAVCNKCSEELNLGFDFTFLGMPKIH